MKTKTQITKKIEEFEKRIQEIQEIQDKTNPIDNVVGFGWYAGNVEAIEHLRHQILLLEWVLNVKN